MAPRGHSSETNIFLVERSHKRSVANSHIAFEVFMYRKVSIRAPTQITAPTHLIKGPFLPANIRIDAKSTKSGLELFIDFHVIARALIRNLTIFKLVKMEML